MNRFHRRFVLSIWLLVSPPFLCLCPSSYSFFHFDIWASPWSSMLFSLSPHLVLSFSLSSSSLTLIVALRERDRNWQIGVESGYYQFTSHLIAELIRVVSKGSAPGNNLLLDALYQIIAIVSLDLILPSTSHSASFSLYTYPCGPHSDSLYRPRWRLAGRTDLEDDYRLASQGIQEGSSRRIGAEGILSDSQEMILNTCRYHACSRCQTNCTYSTTAATMTGSVHIT